MQSCQQASFSDSHNKKAKIRCYYHLNIQQNFGNRSTLYPDPSQHQACKEVLSLTQGQMRPRRDWYTFRSTLFHQILLWYIPCYLLSPHIKISKIFKNITKKAQIATDGKMQATKFFIVNCATTNRFLCWIVVRCMMTALRVLTMVRMRITLKY